MKIAILTPSRGRPAQLQEMIDATRDTADCPDDVTVMIGVDEDDASNYLPEYPGSALFVGPRLHLGAWTNKLSELALDVGFDVLASLGDDHRPRTQGWDSQIREAFGEMGPGLVYTRDGLQDERLPTAPFWSSDIISELGFFCPPPLHHMFVDDFWLRLGRALDRVRYLPTVLIEHMHPAAGKADPDPIYQENDFWFDHDREAFDAYLCLMFDTDVARVRMSV